MYGASMVWENSHIISLKRNGCRDFRGGKKVNKARYAASGGGYE